MEMPPWGAITKDRLMMPKGLIDNIEEPVFLMFELRLHELPLQQIQSGVCPIEPLRVIAQRRRGPESEGALRGGSLDAIVEELLTESATMPATEFHGVYHKVLSA